jgi:hypothetical protein
VPTFVDRGVSRGQRGGSPTVVNLICTVYYISQTHTHITIQLNATKIANASSQLFGTRNKTLLGHSLIATTNMFENALIITNCCYMKANYIVSDINLTLKSLIYNIATLNA